MQMLANGQRVWLAGSGRPALGKGRGERCLGEYARGASLACQQVVDEGRQGCIGCPCLPGKQKLMRG